MIRRAAHRIAQQAATGPSLLRAPVAPILQRFAAGDQVDAAIDVAVELTDEGFSVSLERSTSMVEVADDPHAVMADLRGALEAVTLAGIASITELIVFPHALGVLAHPRRTEEQIAELIDLAVPVGATVMLGAGPPESLTASLDLARALRDGGHPVGVTLQAAMRRSESDCVAFADGAVRLVKGAYHVSGGAVFTSAAEVDKSFIRCVKTLLGTSAQISLATHDERIIRVVDTLVDRTRSPQVEWAFFLGRHTALQARVLHQGWPVRVYVPFGPDWFTRMVDAFAERPTTLVSALRSMVTGP